MSFASTPLSIVSGSAKTADGWSQEAVQDPPSAQKATLRTDGGYQAWASLVGGFFVATVTFGYVNAFGVYQDVYTREGTASASAISWIGSTQLFCVLAMGLPGGILLDKGYYRITLAIGSLLYVFSLFMVSIADRSKYYQLYLSQGLGMGIGAGLIYVPTMALQGQHWRARRALAMGVVVCGSSVGGIIFPIMLNQLFHGSTGFEWGVRASAFIVLALLLASNLLLYPGEHLVTESFNVKDFEKFVRRQDVQKTAADGDNGLRLATGSSNAAFLAISRYSQYRYIGLSKRMA